MAAEHDDLLGPLASAKLGHHVARRNVREGLRVHLEADGDALAALLHAVEHPGILGCEGGMGDLGNAWIVRHGTGVGGVDRKRPGGANQRGDGTRLGGHDGAAGAVGDVDAIVDPLRIVEHDFPPGLLSPRLQLLPG